MARHPEGFRIYIDPRTRKYIVRFTFAGERIVRSTGERDFGRAKIAAARIYAAAHRELEQPAAEPIINTEEANGAPVVEVALDVACSFWLAAIETALDETTTKGYRLYVRCHWQPFFKTVAGITESRAAAYIRERLRRVRRATLLKELSALRGFLLWAKNEEYITQIPPIHSPPRTATGVDHDKGKRKKVRVELTPEEAGAILAALPVRTSHSKLPARAFFTTMWETSLRRSTLFAISTPGDYAKGSATLRIRDEADKVRFGRDLPLSRRARAALDSVCPKSGFIFTSGSYRAALHVAATAAGLSAFRARHLSYHDWRHAALSHMASTTTDLVGMAYLAGHKDVATTAKYVHANKKAAERVIAARERGE